MSGSRTDNLAKLTWKPREFAGFWLLFSKDKYLVNDKERRGAQIIVPQHKFFNTLSFLHSGLLACLVPLEPSGHSSFISFLSTAHIANSCECPGSLFKPGHWEELQHTGTQTDFPSPQLTSTSAWDSPNAKMNSKRGSRIHYYHTTIKASHCNSFWATPLSLLNKQRIIFSVALKKKPITVQTILQHPECPQKVAESSSHFFPEAVSSSHRDTHLTFTRGQSVRSKDPAAIKKDV